MCDGPLARIELPGDNVTSSGLEWGALTLIVLTLSGAGYIGTGMYFNQKKGKQGTDLLPNTKFWSTLAGLVSAGVHFSRAKLGALHPSLAFVTPAGGDNGYFDVETGRSGEKGALALEGEAPAQQSGKRRVQENSMRKTKKKKKKKRRSGEELGQRQQMKPKAKPRPKNPPSIIGVSAGLE